MVHPFVDNIHINIYISTFHGPLGLFTETNYLKGSYSDPNIHVYIIYVASSPFALKLGHYYDPHQKTSLLKYYCWVGSSQGDLYPCSRAVTGLCLWKTLSLSSSWKIVCYQKWVVLLGASYLYSSYPSLWWSWHVSKFGDLHEFILEVMCREINDWNHMHACNAHNFLFLLRV